MQDKDQQLVDSIKSELNESVDNISARDLSAITQARNQALEPGQTSPGMMKKNFSWIFVPAGAIATACLAVVVYSFMQVTPVATDGQRPVPEELVQGKQVLEEQGLVSTFEDLDYYEDTEFNEELDFYEWLDAYESSS
jgi:hypothetical protein